MNILCDDLVVNETVYNNKGNLLVTTSSEFLSPKDTLLYPHTYVWSLHYLSLLFYTSPCGRKATCQTCPCGRKATFSNIPKDTLLSSLDSICHFSDSRS